ncbi:Reverse transcriptase domain-containing protein, partial [Aphis craccivora]
RSCYLDRRQTSPELTEKANKALERLSLWANERKLTFSAGKTQTIWLIGSLTADKPLDLRIGDLKVKMTTVAKYFGVTFDQERKFSDHLAEKANDSVGLFSRLLSKAKSVTGDWATR